MPNIPPTANRRWTSKAKTKVTHGGGGRNLEQYPRAGKLIETHRSSDLHHAGPTSTSFALTAEISVSQE